MTKFRGHSYRNLDAKGRLMIPVEFRQAAKQLGSDSSLVLTNFDGCAVAYPVPEWERIEDGFNNINVLDKRLRNFQRFFISGAVEVAFDKQGRILLASHLRSYARLDKELVIAGVGRKFEIWNKDTFEIRRQELESSFDSDLAELASNGFELRL